MKDMLNWIATHDVYIEFGIPIMSEIPIIMRKYMSTTYAEAVGAIEHREFEIRGEQYIVNLLDSMRRDIDRVPVGKLKKRNDIEPRQTDCPWK